MKTVTVARLLVTMMGIAYNYVTCGLCQREYACRYHCLCFLLCLCVYL